jgi:hypothetical protein
MKRFVDTDMMLRPWFRSLKPRLKCLWLWMLTRCDMAGVLDMDWGLASFAIGEECTEMDLDAMNGNVQVISGTKIWLTGFIRFQYGELSESSKVHQGVLRVMASHGIEYHKGIDRLSGVENTPKDKDIDKAKDKDNQGDARGKQFEPPHSSEVSEYCKEKGIRIDAVAFCAFYASKGWMVGKTKMKDWKAAVIGWDRRNKENKQTQQQQIGLTINE